MSNLFANWYLSRFVREVLSKSGSLNFFMNLFTIFLLCSLALNKAAPYSLTIRSAFLALPISNPASKNPIRSNFFETLSSWWPLNSCRSFSAFSICKSSNDAKLRNISFSLSQASWSCFLGPNIFFIIFFIYLHGLLTPRMRSAFFAPPPSVGWPDQLEPALNLFVRLRSSSWALTPPPGGVCGSV